MSDSTPVKNGLIPAGVCSDDECAARWVRSRSLYSGDSSHVFCQMAVMAVIYICTFHIKAVPRFYI